MCFYRRQRSCGQGYVFTPVCDSVPGGVSASVHAGIPPTWSRHHLGADTPPEQTPHPLGADTPWSRHPPGADTPPPTPQEQTPLGADTPPGADTSPEQTHTPPEQTPPPPPRKTYSSIRSTSGRYAFYWNAFLFFWRSIDSDYCPQCGSNQFKPNFDYESIISDCRWSNLTKSALTIGMLVKADKILTRTEQILSVSQNVLIS